MKWQKWANFLIVAGKYHELSDSRKSATLFHVAKEHAALEMSSE